MNPILDTLQFKTTIKQIAKAQDRPEEEVWADAERYLKEMLAEHNPIVDISTDLGSQFILSRAFDKKIDVDPEQIEMVRELMRTHSVAFVITHKSYIDTIVLNVLFSQNRMPLAYTFAGINLDFFGLGSVLRRMGAIFIRRSFKDNETYKAVLKQYIGSLVKQKSRFMWAIEGTRSRTGKLLWPKLGILKYVVDASRHLGDVERVKYVPVSLNYDLLPDVPQLTAERTGKEKKSEGLSWLVGYINQMRKHYGKIAVRFGEPVSLTKTPNSPEAVSYASSLTADQETLQRLAFELVYRINQSAAVTTTSLVCTSLLSRFAAKRSEVEVDVARLMELIGAQRPKAVVERDEPIDESVPRSLRLLEEQGVVERRGQGVKTRYAIARESYLHAVYYSNMSIHLLVNRAFTEIALLRCVAKPPEQRELSFWAEIARLRDMFKYEFFYSPKAEFSDEIEEELALISPEWRAILAEGTDAVEDLLRRNQPLVSHAVLEPYVDAYRVTGHTLLNQPIGEAIEQGVFVDDCLSIGEELHWQGRIRRLEAVSKPFLTNGFLLAGNRGLIEDGQIGDRAQIERFISKLDEIGGLMERLQGLVSGYDEAVTPALYTPPSKAMTVILQEVLDGPEGAHVGAFFDLDRTLIAGYSAVDFVQERVLSGKMSSGEAYAQFSQLLTYAAGNRNFASMAAVGAKGVEGASEAEFMAFGEEVVEKHLIDAIYSESRQLLRAHLAKGHTVAIVSAATPYQVEPLARELGIEHVMCTRLEVKKGKLTGNLIEPPCWGDGKAHYGRELAEKLSLDLGETYFYTDSHEDIQLLEIVGKPRPLNPDRELFRLSAERGWLTYRFINPQNDKAGAVQAVRTGLAYGGMVPTFIAGAARAVMTGSRTEGVNAMISTLGELGTRLSGISLNIRGEDNMWAHRPAVFIFNHQSGTDLIIGAKLLQKDVTAIAKEELKTSMVGPLLMAGGVVFVERGNKEKSAAEQLQPAVDALAAGTSIAIAPEGTRSGNRRLGEFKKGAFHIAMQAGVPLVPIVIHNASDALPKGAVFIRSTTVDVTVLPPISTEGWTVDMLDEKVAEVRGLFLEELGHIE